MYGDTNYQWVQSGSTTASAATAHGLFGAYNGLSLLNTNDVLHVQVMAITNNFELLKTVTPSTGFLFQTSASYYYDLPPMNCNSASQMHFRNQTGASNATVMWNIWRRVSN